MRPSALAAAPVKNEMATSNLHDEHEYGVAMLDNVIESIGVVIATDDHEGRTATLRMWRITLLEARAKIAGDTASAGGGPRSA